MEREKYPCVILCGGRSTRFGGNKISALLGGKPIVGHVIDRVSPQCAAMAINNLREDIQACESLQNLMDDMPNLGPLSGVLTAMKWAKQSGHTRVLTTPADTPFLPLDWAEKLGQADEHTIAVSQTGSRDHRASALWPTALYNDLHTFLTKADTYKVGVFQSAHPVQYISFPTFNTQDPFFNINTRDDLEQAELYLGS